MAVNRTISECKLDLRAAADAVTSIRTSYLIEPTEISTDDLPVFSVLNGVETEDFEVVDTLEQCYDARYEFDTVIVVDDDCLESEVITIRNAYYKKILELQQAAGTRPFRIIGRPRIYEGHWGNVRGWFIRTLFSRYVVEDFTP